eukprot:5570089-Amphidinium_carterae.1
MSSHPIHRILREDSPKDKVSEMGRLGPMTHVRCPAVLKSFVAQTTRAPCLRPEQNVTNRCKLQLQQKV